MKSKQGLIKQTGKALKKASPKILSCLGALGVVATAVLAVKATPKALERIEDAKEAKGPENGGKLTRLEMIIACWQCYIPAAATGIATVGCIIGANVLNRRQQASLASAYALVSRSYDDYKQKVKEMAGEDVHQKIMESIAAERVSKDHTIIAQGYMGNSSLDFDDTAEDEHLFYDAFSGRYFTSTVSKVLQAEYHLNRNFALSGGGIALNHFYNLLGIDDIPEGDTIGWFVNDEMYWIDFDHSKVTLEDGLECYIIDMVYTPGTEEDYCM